MLLLLLRSPMGLHQHLTTCPKLLCGHRMLLTPNQIIPLVLQTGKTTMPSCCGANSLYSPTLKTYANDSYEGSPLRDLFAEPPASILHVNQGERQRNSCFRALRIEQRAQRVLAWSNVLATFRLPQGSAAVEHALQDYLDLYPGPLPQQLITALVVLFKLDDEAMLPSSPTRLS